MLQVHIVLLGALTLFLAACLGSQDQERQIVALQTQVAELSQPSPSATSVATPSPPEPTATLGQPIHEPPTPAREYTIPDISSLLPLFAPLKEEELSPRPLPGLGPGQQELVREERLRYRKGETSEEKLLAALRAAGLPESLGRQVLEAERAAANAFALKPKLFEQSNLDTYFEKRKDYDRGLSAYREAEREARHLARQSLTVAQRLDEVAELLEAIEDRLDGLEGSLDYFRDSLSTLEDQMYRLKP